MSKSAQDEPRSREEEDGSLDRLPPMKFEPLVGPDDLREVAKVFRAIPALEYPIGSAGELIAKLGGRDRTFQIARVRTAPFRMVKYMPAYYFPIVSVENFVEKMAELIRANRKPVDLPAAVASLKHQLPQLTFPIATMNELLRQIGKRSIVYGATTLDPAKVAVHVPAEYFPLKSERDFEVMIRRMLLTRPLIAPD